MADIIEYRIIGDDLQAVIITLDPGEACVAEAGAFLYMQDGITMATHLSMKGGQGGSIFGKLFEAGKRALTGDSFFITFFANEGPRRADVSFSAPVPGKIVPIDLAAHRGELLCQKDSFLCAARGVDVGIAFTRKFGAGLFGGEGFILQKLSAPTGGLAFLHAGGTVIEQTLAPGQTLRVDTGCLVAFESTVDYDIQTVPGIKNKLFGGEGLFFVLLRGPGKVWLQTLPFNRLADRIVATAGGGGQSEQGSVLGGLGNLISGD
ncbi:MAG: TIGR00266 family protein [Planctomycetes bacterium]|nr:TIGR00266 family protein [Planctomycetota bacterium]